MSNYYMYDYLLDVHIYLIIKLIIYITIIQSKA